MLSLSRLGQRAAGAVCQQPGGSQPSNPAVVPDGERQPAGGLPASTRSDPNLHFPLQVGWCPHVPPPHPPAAPCISKDPSVCLRQIRILYAPDQLHGGPVSSSVISQFYLIRAAILYGGGTSERASRALKFRVRGASNHTMTIPFSSQNS